MLYNCTISGLPISLDHGLHHTIKQGNTIHPIFNATPQNLIESMESFAWINRGRVENTELENIYLHTLALLNSTGLVSWHTPCNYSPQLGLACLRHLANLIDIVCAMDVCKNTKAQFASINCTPETETISNLANWIKTWNSNLNDFYAGNLEQELAHKIYRIEDALAYLANSNQVKNKQDAAKLANWAMLESAAEEELASKGNSYISLIDYWHGMIIAACMDNADEKNKYAPGDYSECRDYMRDNLEYGSPLTNHILACLDAAKNYTSGADIGIAPTVGGINNTLDELIRYAELVPPILKDKKEYANVLEYVKAKAAYMDYQANYVNKLKDI